MPKTFITRKGALLLFSEDLAIRMEQEEKAKRRGNKAALSNEDLGLKTVDDLAKSILCYGSQVSEIYDFHSKHNHLVYLNFSMA